MKKILSVAVFLCLFFLLPTLSPAKGIDLYSLFPNLTLGSDPNGTDYVYLSCAGITANTFTLQVHVVTDNVAPMDYLQGIDVCLVATANQPGVTFDTTEATVFASSAVNGWGIKSVDTPNGPPNSFPLVIHLGAVELDTADAGSVLGPGDYVFATLKFNLTSRTDICGAEINDCDPTLVTTLANGYIVHFSPPETCCDCRCFPIPTLSEWGLILFGLVLFGTLIWYLRRSRQAIAG